MAGSCSSISATATARPRSFSPRNAATKPCKQSKALRSEDVILVRGEVARRPEGTVNPKLETGEIEVRVRHLEILNQSAPPPFQPGSKELPGEDLRLKYRYIDLRRPKMQQTLLLRHRIIKSMRDYFDEQRFIEVETPMLGRSTPEGARDYLVPSRVVQGHFYALPQSPQLYKQILMVAGYDRYIQVARCFRDEDLRADRQPEFTQLDLEMSFVTAEDIIGVIDGLMARLAKEILGLELTLPLPRMTYDEAMERFGHDAPDLRFGMELVDITDLAREAEFRVFRDVAEGGNRVRGINAKGAAGRYSRKGIDELTAFIVENFGAKGLAWFKVEEDGTLASPIAKNFSPELLAKIAQRMDAAPGDFLLFVADKFEVTCKALYALRKRLGAELKLYDPNEMNFSWVVEFPMFAYDEEEGGWAAMHHPFTSPRPQDCDMLGDRSRQVPGPGLRPGDQRLRGRRRHDPYPRPAAPAAGVRAVGHRPSDGPRAVRLPVGRLAIRRPAARRHRPGHRPRGDALRRAGQHPRRDRLPQDAAGHRPDDRRPRRGRRQAIAGVGDQGEQGRTETLVAVIRCVSSRGGMRRDRRPASKLKQILTVPNEPPCALPTHRKVINMARMTSPSEHRHTCPPRGHGPDRAGAGRSAAKPGACTSSRSRRPGGSRPI